MLVGDAGVVSEGPSPDSIDVDLVRRARSGEQSAWNALYERYSKAVHAIILARVPAADVDDLVQDVFLVALRRVSSLREAERVGGWLMSIARNRATDYLRRRKDSEEISEELGAATPRSAEASRALRAIRELPEAYREVMMMRLVEGMSGPEIAERTGMTHGSVRVNLNRGMKILRERLEIEVSR